MFAGAGGTSAGLTAANIDVVAAINHWPEAVAWHELNHPNTAHFCEDLSTFDHGRLHEHHIDLVFASPACQGHSTAAQPARARNAAVRTTHDNLRGSAWCVIDAVETLRPNGFAVENVPSFEQWTLYEPWRAALQTLGYRVETHVLTATDFDVPQARRRMFITGTLGDPVTISPTTDTAPAIEPHIDLSDDVPGYRSIADASDSVRTQIETARRHQQSLGNRHDAFLWQRTTGHRGRPLSEPIATLTTASGHWQLIHGDRYRSLTPTELAAAMGFPTDFKFPAGISQSAATKGLGNAVCPPVATAVANALTASLASDVIPLFAA